MSEYDNTNSGMMARNERKQTENHPDFTGTANIAGLEYWVSAYVKEGNPGGKMAGKKFFKMTYKLKDGQQQAPAAKAAPKPAVPEFDDDIGF